MKRRDLYRKINRKKRELNISKDELQKFDMRKLLALSALVTRHRWEIKR